MGGEKESSQKDVMAALLALSHDDQVDEEKRMKLPSLNNHGGSLPRGGLVGCEYEYTVMNDSGNGGFGRSRSSASSPPFRSESKAEEPSDSELLRRITSLRQTGAQEQREESAARLGQWPSPRFCGDVGDSPEGLVFRSRGRGRVRRKP